MDGKVMLHNAMDLLWPNALTLDYDTDAGLDRLERSRTDGSERILLSMLHIYNPFGVTFLWGSVVWSDWQLSGILSGVTIGNLTAVQGLLLNITYTPTGVIAACEERQTRIPNPCAGNCDNTLCLNSEQLRASGILCLCIHTH